MRHLKTGRKLNRTSSHRKALLRNLAASLFLHESIKTTNPKALELRKVADHLITLAKGKTLHDTRLAFAYLRHKEAVKKLFTDISARYADTNGGYTRVVKIGRRKGDAAPMAIIELTLKKEPEKEEKKEARGKKESKEKKEPREKKATKEKKEAEGKKEAKGPKEKKEAKGKKETKEAKGPKEKKEAKEAKGKKKELKATQEKKD